MNLKRIGLIACLLPTLALPITINPSFGNRSVFRSSRQNPVLKQEVNNIFSATNNARVAKGRPALQQDAKLMKAAQQYAELMASREEMSHTLGGLTLLDKAQKVGYSFRTLSENIATNTDLDGQFVVDEQWMKSKGHRKNLLADDVTQIGIGVAGPGTRTKRYYYCQIFGAPLTGRVR
ncbi:hypothetical protein GCM10027592_38070 [Spirosoma flavus]